ncbi:restriction system protein [Paenibacillus cellulosilyticus]|uniref:Restriction system protein n=1 Tax=Paenibacillus cellulosilyticus TaxID=375489 RepID=A0A2V2YY79_9BACL|nr:restriction endonuclease [Paenibacillus cellulosilyticus]PWV97911.1 restriction system protein [Paenibacillus cellulosilyticus]QKS46920.1 restriction endonuclease [Paenibacillus cellulosilyticus]
MNILLSLSIAAICYLLFRDYKQRKLLNSYRAHALEAFTSHEDMKETLRIGLYNRFKREEDADKEEDPLLFEHFVADIMTSVRGGRTFVTKGSGDYGIDIEEQADKGLYLGQVKCCKDPVGYEPIAIIHSQMMKQDAVGGYVVTTSKFTPNAYAYAKGLNIDLINGTQLVEIWMDYLDDKRESVGELLPLPQV